MLRFRETKQYSVTYRTATGNVRTVRVSLRNPGDEWEIDQALYQAGVDSRNVAAVVKV